MKHGPFGNLGVFSITGQTLARCPGRNAAGYPGVDTPVIQLNDLVIDITNTLRRTLGEHITLSTSLAREVWPTRADPGQFHSATITLAVNAAIRCRLLTDDPQGLFLEGSQLVA